MRERKCHNPSAVTSVILAFTHRRTLPIHRHVYPASRRWTGLSSGHSSLVCGNRSLGTSFSEARQRGYRWWCFERYFAARSFVPFAIKLIAVTEFCLSKYIIMRSSEIFTSRGGSALNVGRRGHLRKIALLSPLPSGLAGSGDRGGRCVPPLSPATTFLPSLALLGHACLTRRRGVRMRAARHVGPPPSPSVAVWFVDPLLLCSRRGVHRPLNMCAV